MQDGGKRENRSWDPVYVRSVKPKVDPDVAVLNMSSKKSEDTCQSDDSNDSAFVSLDEFRRLKLNHTDRELEILAVTVKVRQTQMALRKTSFTVGFSENPSDASNESLHGSSENDGIGRRYGMMNKVHATAEVVKDRPIPVGNLKTAIDTLHGLQADQAVEALVGYHENLPESIKENEFLKGALSVSVLWAADGR